jgi:N6-adenosine-specific RNA methylase IME4
LSSGASETQLYDRACRALAEAVAVNEVMAIRGRAEQLAACARIANNHRAEADAVTLRMRATRRLGQLMQAQKDSVGFNRGAAGGGTKNRPRRSIVNPRDLRPTLASQGIGNWRVWPELPGALEVNKACGFEYKSVGFVWVKTTKNAQLINVDGDGLHWGMGYATRANTEVCLLATHGWPWRLAADLHQVVLAPVGEHSAKPGEVARRIERLYPGPYLELFARRPREGWTCWGNELPPPDPGEMPPHPIEVAAPTPQQPPPAHVDRTSQPHPNEEVR